MAVVPQHGSRALYSPNHGIQGAMRDCSPRIVGEYLHSPGAAQGPPLRVRYVAGAGRECCGHQVHAWQYLAAEMPPPAIECIDSYGRADVDDETGVLKLGPGADHRDPSIDAHAPRLLVTVDHTAGFPQRPREMNVASAVHADHT